MMESGPLISLSPSFNSYSSSRMAEIAARVVEECRVERSFATEEEGNDDVSHVNAEEHLVQKSDENSPSETNKEVEKLEGSDESDSDEDDDFEFSFVTRGVDSSTITADEIFFNGQIRPTFPVFGKDLSSESKPPPRVRLPLGRFLIEERQASISSSSSSSEVDELDGVLPGTYCVWTPKRPAEEQRRRKKKSNSTGSSKRWKLLELIGRSNSDGKVNFVF